jgi:hypothetical protein
MNLQLSSILGPKPASRHSALRNWSGIFLSAVLVASCGKETEATSAKTPAANAPVTVAPPAQPAAAKPTPPQAKPDPTQPPKSEPQPVAKLEPAPAKAAPAVKLLITLEQLSLRRDLWPEKVTLKQPIKLSAKETLAAGREFAMQEMLGQDVAIDTGAELVQVTGSDTDILERASATMAALTPEQLALTEQMLPSRPDLWPLEVKLKSTLQFSNGNQVPAGSVEVLRAFNGYSMSVYDRKLKDHFMCEVPETDIMKRARERMLLPEAERTPFFLRSLAAAVDPVANSKLESSKFILVYQGRLDCPRCAAFAPQLKEFYARIKPEHPEFEAVYLGLDVDPQVTREHAKQAQYPGQVLVFEKRLETGDLGSLGGQLLPLVFLMDEQGKVLARNHPNGGSPSAADVLTIAEAKITSAK